MNTTLFDKILWRFNGSVIALLCVCSLILFTFSCIGLVINNLSRKNLSSAYESSESHRLDDKNFNLSDFHRIQGTPFLVASLGKDYSSSSPYSYSDYVRRNFLFFDMRNGHSHWLAPNNSSVFSAHELSATPTLKPEEKKIISLIYEVNPAIKKVRTNSEEGEHSVLFYNLTGASPKTILKNIDKFLGIQQFDTDKTILLFRQNDKNYALSLKTSSGAVLETNELAPIPKD